MTTSTLIYVVLAFSVISTESLDNNGMSSYCEKSRRYPSWYISPPIECCDYHGKCDDVIRPMETQYGLTNPEPEWSRRNCSCDRQLYRCVTKDLKPSSTAWVRAWGFKYLTCFEETFLEYNGSWYSIGPKFWPVLNALGNEENAVFPYETPLLRRFSGKENLPKDYK